VFLKELISLRLHPSSSSVGTYTSESSKLRGSGLNASFLRKSKKLVFPLTSTIGYAASVPELPMNEFGYLSELSRSTPEIDILLWNAFRGESL